MPKERACPAPATYQFKVVLKGIRPPIWRRFLVPNSITLYRLHLVLQTVMGWENCHLYQFVIDGLRYTDPDPYYRLRDINARRVKLWQVLAEPKTKFLYEYDFGDSWQHELVLEKVLPPAEGVECPVCLQGARACPPEDSGGPWGYQMLLEAASDPEHKKHRTAIEWLGSRFDPEAFDLDHVNWQLKKLRLK